jgi:hypothetical protein
MFMNFWNGDFKKIMGKEEEMLFEMKERISFHQTASALFPATFFLSSSNEMSSRGFSAIVEFNEYTQGKKREFIWFIADIYILSNKVNEWKELAPFPKENENIYKGQIRLPGNYSFGLAVPEALKEIAGKYVYTLEQDQKGKVLSEISRSLKADVIIFDNFLAGLSDDIILYFADVLKSLKKDSTIVYFTNSLMVTAVICDPVHDHIHKWTKEQIAF